MIPVVITMSTLSGLLLLALIIILVSKKYKPKQINVQERLKNNPKVPEAKGEIKYQVQKKKRVKHHRCTKKNTSTTTI